MSAKLEDHSKLVEIASQKRDSAELKNVGKDIEIIKNPASRIAECPRCGRNALRYFSTFENHGITYKYAHYRHGSGRNRFTHTMRLDQDEQTDTRVTIRLTPDTKQLLENKCEEMSCTTSDFIRALLTDSLAEEPEEIDVEIKNEVCPVCVMPGSPAKIALSVKDKNYWFEGVSHDGELHLKLVDTEPKKST